MRRHFETRTQAPTTANRHNHHLQKAREFPSSHDSTPVLSLLPRLQGEKEEKPTDGHEQLLDIVVLLGRGLKEQETIGVSKCLAPLQSERGDLPETNLVRNLPLIPKISLVSDHSDRDVFIHVSLMVEEEDKQASLP